MEQSDDLAWVDGTEVIGSGRYVHFDTGFPENMPKRYDCGLIISGKSDT